MRDPRSLSREMFPAEVGPKSRNDSSSRPATERMNSLNPLEWRRIRWPTSRDSPGFDDELLRKKSKKDTYPQCAAEAALPTHDSILREGQSSGEHNELGGQGCPPTRTLLLLFCSRQRRHH